MFHFSFVLILLRADYIIFLFQISYFMKVFYNFSKTDMPPVQAEANSPLRHPDFDDSIVTSIYDFMDLYANGRDIPVAKRSPVYDEDADKLFKTDAVPTMDYDLLDANDDYHSTKRDNDDLNDDDANE